MLTGSMKNAQDLWLIFQYWNYLQCTIKKERYYSMEFTDNYKEIAGKYFLGALFFFSKNLSFLDNNIKKKDENSFC
jgi:hypothetical protein